MPDELVQLQRTLREFCEREVKPHVGAGTTEGTSEVQRMVIAREVLR